MRTQRTFTAIAAAAVGALLLSGCATDTDTGSGATPAPDASTEPASADTSDSGEHYVEASSTTDEQEPELPIYVAVRLDDTAAVWDQGLSFAAANAFSESATEETGDTDAMPDDYEGLMAA